MPSVDLDKTGCHGHPLGYFTGVMPGDGSYLDWLQDNYGSWFERITIRQKLWLLSQLCQSLAEVQDKVEGFNPWYQEVPDDEVMKIVSEVRSNVKCRDAIRLIEALVDQVINQRTPG